MVCAHTFWAWVMGGHGSAGSSHACIWTSTSMPSVSKPIEILLTSMTRLRLDSSASCDVSDSAAQTGQDGTRRVM